LAAACRSSARIQHFLIGLDGHRAGQATLLQQERKAVTAELDLLSA
jgi:hypothetical protein